MIAIRSPLETTGRRRVSVAGRWHRRLLSWSDPRDVRIGLDLPPDRWLALVGPKGTVDLGRPTDGSTSTTAGPLSPGEGGGAEYPGRCRTVDLGQLPPEQRGVAARTPTAHGFNDGDGGCVRVGVRALGGAPQYATGAEECSRPGMPSAAGGRAIAPVRARARNACRTAWDMIGGPEQARSTTRGTPRPACTALLASRWVGGVAAPKPNRSRVGVVPEVAPPSHGTWLRWRWPGGQPCKPR